MNIPFYGTKMKINEKLKDFLYIAFPILLMALCAIVLVVIFIKQTPTMEGLHCKKTGNVDKTEYFQSTFGANGQSTGGYWMEIEQYEYQCDDGIRWQ